MAGPSPEALAAAQAAAQAGLAPPPGEAIDPTAGGGRVPAGQVVAGRRMPTKEEIAKINAALAAYEAQHAVGAASAAPAPPVITPPAPVPRPPGKADGGKPDSPKPRDDGGD